MTSLYPFLFSSSAIAYLALGFWVVLRQKEKVQKLYGLLCLTTCIWQAIWAALFAAPDAKWIDLFLKFCFSGVVYIPSIIYQFINEFTGGRDPKTWVRWTYVISFLLAGFVWCSRLVINGFNRFSWG